MKYSTHKKVIVKVTKVKHAKIEDVPKLEAEGLYLLTNIFRYDIFIRDFYNGGI